MSIKSGNFLSPSPKAKMRRFEEIKTIGDGAFGIVTKCRDKETGEIVAIKRMKQRYATFDECLQLKEVKSLRKIKHENVVKLLQVFRENDHLFLVFEFCADGSLLKTIRDHSGPFSESEIRDIAFQMFEGLAYIHRQGFFHRDMKPENLFWLGKTLKIGDFGLAREIRSRPPYTEYISTRWYRAPEIVLRHDFYNSPVDIWAAGCIMAELYLQKPLFQGNTEADQFYKICSILGTPGPGNWPDGVKLANRLNIRMNQCAATPLSAVIPGASPEALDLLKEILQYDPAKRPSAAQILQHPFFKKTPAVPKPVPVPEKIIDEIPSELEVQPSTTKLRSKASKESDSTRLDMESSLGSTLDKILSLVVDDSDDKPDTYISPKPTKTIRVTYNHDVNQLDDDLFEDLDD